MMSSRSSCGENPSASHISSGCVVFVTPWELDGIKSTGNLARHVVTLGNRLKPPLLRLRRGGENVSNGARVVMGRYFDEPRF